MAAGCRPTSVELDVSVKTPAQSTTSSTSGHGPFVTDRPNEADRFLYITHCVIVDSRVFVFVPHHPHPPPPHRNTTTTIRLRLNQESEIDSRLPLFVALVNCVNHYQHVRFVSLHTLLWLVCIPWNMRRILRKYTYHLKSIECSSVYVEVYGAKVHTVTTYAQS